MKHPQRIFASAAVAVLFSFAAQAQVVVMQPLTTFGINADGSVRPNDVPCLTSTNQFERGIAYNPTTGHLLVVDRSPAYSSANCDVHIINGDTGAYIGKLDNSSTLAGGTAGFTLNLIGVGNDGAIYVANITSSTAGAPQTRLYRWNDELSLQTIVSPTGSFPSDDPSSGSTVATQKRWGDTMSVRGSGLGTQILLANRGTLAALYTPDDGTYAHFTPKTLTTDVATGALGYGLTFGAGDTFWGTSGANGNGPLLRLSFNAGAGTAATLNTFYSSNFPGTVSPILAMPSSNLLAGITMVTGADVVRLYDISNPNSPVLMDRKSFATANDNNVFGGSLTLGTNGVLYALDSDNGIMAFTLAGTVSNPLPPAFFLNPVSLLVPVSGNLTLTAGADSSLPVHYYWQFYGTNLVRLNSSSTTNASVTLTNLAQADTGNYSVIASNSLGSVTSSVAVVTVVLSPPNSLLKYEPFPYAVGSLIGGQGGWFTSASFGAVSNGSLTIPGLDGSKSNMLSWGSSTVSMRLTNGATTLSGSIYLSFAYQLDPASTVPAPGASGGAVAGFASGNTSTYFAPKIVVRTNSTAPGSYDMGVFKGGTEVNGAFAANVLSQGQTVFVVARYTFEDGTSDDTCALWVNPSPSTFGAASAPTPSAVTPNTSLTADHTQIDRFFFRQSGGPSRSYADEVRVGLTWADVTPPQPTLTTTANGNGTVTLSWPTLSTGYSLESAINLNSPITWTAVTDTVTIVGNKFTVTVNAGTGEKYFRLKK